MAAESFANSLVVEVEGGPLPADVKSLLTHAFVDDSRNLPDVFALRFRDPGHVVLGKGKFTIGAKIALKVQTSDPGGPQPLMSGEVTAVGVELDAGGTFTEVRGYDLGHRLFRGRRVASYPNMTVADVVRKVAQRADIPVGQIDDVKGFGRPHTQLSQDGVSDWEFLSRLAGLVGAQIAVVAGKLEFGLPEEPTSAPAATAKAKANPLVLELHRTLLSLRAAITAAEQVPEVRVRGWDDESKQAVVAVKPANALGTEVTGLDPVALGAKFAAPPFLANGAHRNQAVANAVASALATQLGGACAELAGVARGNPKLRAGTAVALTNVGEPFAGKYTLAGTRHLFTEQTGYTTEFTVSGRQERSLYGLANGGAHGSPDRGLVPAIVSDVRDPAKAGRVKVTYPWLAPDFAGGWARTVHSSAGNGYGELVLPEVGDEVLVGFEHGDFDAPYVLGGLYNGKDKPPTLAKEPVDANSGEVTARGFVSRKHHKVEFVEDEGITIASGDGKFVVRLDQKNQVVEVTSGKAVTIKARDGVTIDAGSGPLELKGQKITATARTDVAIEAGAQLKASGTAGVKVEGATVAVTGQGQAELTASGPVTVRGAVVRIN
ncbi:type IV secretion protein Rhs [Saccharothrix sp. NRRL B-16348]|uniref:VgrG-related protein n=1 Tax=Saccharothrix sp. NRRL B-16348 TaxID=1415542 RepID=UPI0006AF482C|nr:VgrG-related protein [Saccharothrix sp. NRRL B-16348]KOX18761.1 type IV secretion protein Rhs [Saccharothrix sp. NRRL B-16348]